MLQKLLAHLRAVCPSGPGLGADVSSTEVCAGWGWTRESSLRTPAVPGHPPLVTQSPDSSGSVHWRLDCRGQCPWTVLGCTEPDLPSDTPRPSAQS